MVIRYGKGKEILPENLCHGDVFKIIETGAVYMACRYSGASNLFYICLPEGIVQDDELDPYITVMKYDCELILHS